MTSDPVYHLGPLTEREIRVLHVAIRHAKVARESFPPETRRLERMLRRKIWRIDEGEAFVVGMRRVA